MSYLNDPLEEMYGKGCFNQEQPEIMTWIEQKRSNTRKESWHIKYKHASSAGELYLLS